MNQSLCVDANVFISALVVTEKKHGESLLFLKKILQKGFDLYEPDVVVFEVCHALYRKVSLGEIREDHSQALLDHFFRLPLLLRWQGALMQKTARLALKLKYQGISDCAYLAVAQAQEVPLVTWDEELIRKGRSVYPRVICVSDFR